MRPAKRTIALTASTICALFPSSGRTPAFRWSTAGLETAEGKELTLLRITADENVGKAWKDVWVAAIDRSTHLLWEARLTHNLENETWTTPRPTGTTEIVYRYSDYREVSGLWIPHRMEYFSEGRKSGENVVRSIEIDANVTDAIFSSEAHRTR